MVKIEMSKDQVIKKLLEENVRTDIKYHTALSDDISPWYVYTVNSGYRVLCVPRINISEDMTEDDYRSRLVSAPVKTVLRGYSIQEGFIVTDCDYNSDKGFITEMEDREFDADLKNHKYLLSVGDLYFPGITSWPETVEYNYFSNNHELRFFLKNPSKYGTEVVRKMPVQIGLFTRDDIILLVYRFTDYKKQLIPVNGYSPFSIHLVPDNMRTIPAMSPDPGHEDTLRINLIDADTGILKVARSMTLSSEFTAAICSAIIEQSNKPSASDYNERLQELDSRYPDNESLMNDCKVKCAG